MTASVQIPQYFLPASVPVAS